MDTQTVIAGLEILVPKVFDDARGAFFEFYRRNQHSPKNEMLQGSVSISYADVLRGMHFHKKQTDVWLVGQGQFSLAFYDLRVGSPTEGAKIQFDCLGPQQVIIPPGVAHGYLCSGEVNVLTYLVDVYYDNTDEFGIRYDDAHMGLDWHLSGRRVPLLSARDEKQPTYATLRQLGELPVFKP